MHRSDPLRIPELGAATPMDPAGSRGCWSVTAVRYRPGQRHVLRWEQDGTHRQARFAKLDRRDASAQAFRVANRVADWLEGTGEPIAGARPLAHLPEIDVLLDPIGAGSAAHRRPGRAGGGPLAARLVRAGMILRARHGPPAELAEGLPARGFEDAAEEVHKAAGHLRFLLPATGDSLEALLEWARKLHAGLPGEAHVFTHADSKADHLLATPDRLTVIDFDTCSLADPALDLGKLLADLRFWSSRGERSTPTAPAPRSLTATGRRTGRGCCGPAWTRR